MLPINDFINVVRNAPLVAIDLIIKNNEQQVLLGKRVNRPAKNFWFVPGGRIYKNETLSQALSRISMQEINIELDIDKALFKGVFDHLYEENFFEDPSFNTHYVVMAFEFLISSDVTKLSNKQHDEYRYWSIEQLLNDIVVHQYSKNYFISSGIR